MSDVKISIKEKDLIDILNIVEKIRIPKGIYIQDEIAFCRSIINETMKNAQQIKTILANYPISIGKDEEESE